MNRAMGTGARALPAFLVAAAVAVGCSSLEPPPTTGILFTSEPSGAEIFINGGYHGTTPNSVVLTKDIGYTVAFRKAGYQERAYPFSVFSKSVHGVLAVSGIRPDSAGAADSAATTPAPGPATARGTIRSAEPEPPQEGKAIYYDKSAPVTVVLEGGKVLAAASIQQASAGYVKVFLLDGTSKFISKHKIRSVTTRTPADVTWSVIEGGRSYP